MSDRSTESAPVGVVPRRSAPALEPLIHDAADRAPVSSRVDDPAPAAAPRLQQWLSSLAAVGIGAAALEWLKGPG